MRLNSGWRSRRAEDARWQLAMVTAVRCSIACFQNDLARAEAFADQALRDLRDDDPAFRASIYHALGDTYRRNGRWEDAKTMLPARCLTMTHAPGSASSRSSSRCTCSARWPISSCGRAGCGTPPRTGARRWRPSRTGETWGRFELPVIGWVYIRMGEILYEWNDLASAGDHLTRGLERAELGGDVRALIAGYLLAGRLKLTAGDLDGGDATTWSGRARWWSSAQFPDWTGRFERLQLELWLAQDRLRAAVDWADALLHGDAASRQPDSETAQLALARVLIVKGDAAVARRERWRCSNACSRRRRRRAGWASRSRRWRCRRWPTGGAGTSGAR